MVPKWQALPMQPTLYATLLLETLGCTMIQGVLPLMRALACGDQSQTSLPHSAAPLRSQVPSPSGPPAETC